MEAACILKTSGIMSKCAKCAGWLNIITYIVYFNVLIMNPYIPAAFPMLLCACA